MIKIEQLTFVVTCDICGEEIPTAVSDGIGVSPYKITPRGANNILGTITIPIELKDTKSPIERIGDKLYCSRCRNIYYDRLREIEANYESLKRSLPNAVKRIVESDK